MECAIKSLDLLDTPPTATRKVAQVPGAKRGKLALQAASERYILGFERPDLHSKALDQAQSGVEAVHSGNRQIGVQQFLNDLGGGGERRAPTVAIAEKISRRSLEGMELPHGVHEDIRIDEDQLSAKPEARDLSMTARCSSQSGSRPAPSMASQARKKASTSRSDSNGRTASRSRSRARAASRSQALRVTPSCRAAWTNRSRSSSGITS